MGLGRRRRGERPYVGRRRAAATRMSSWMAVLGVGLVLPACSDSALDCEQGGPARIEDAPFAGSLQIDLGQLMRVTEGLYIRDDVIGTGQATFEGAALTVTYTGWFVDGTQFDSGQNFDFTLDVSNVIAGWHQGIKGMRQGGTRTIVIGPALGYGPCPYRGIPGNSILVFEVELTQVGG